MKHVWWWYLFPWVGLARMTEAYEDALVIVREQSTELHKLRLETAGLWRMVRKLGPERYAFQTIEEWEEVLGYKVGDAARIAWHMARLQKEEE